MNSSPELNLPLDNAGEFGISESRINRLIKSIREFATIAEVMRMLGAALLIASMSLLLLNGWHDGDDILRYLKLLSLTGLLTTGGFLLSYFLQEQKGARLFFSLGLVSVPANFGILGALIYSTMPDVGLLPNYPDFARWVVSDVSSVVMVSLGALCVLLPVTILGFKIVSRHSARLLTLSYIGLNSLLLLPFRDPLLVGAMLSVALIVPALVTRAGLARDASLLSVKGKYALSILFIPALLLLARNLYLYQLDYFLGAMFFTSIYWICRQWALSATTGKNTRNILDLMSAPLAYGAALCTANLVESNVFDPLFVGTFSVVLGAYLIDFQRRVVKTLTSQLIVVVTSSVIAGSMVLSVLVFDSVESTIMGVVSGIGLIVFGVYARSRVVMIIGFILTCIAAWSGFNEIITLMLSGDWLALAILGSVTIVGASLVDRFGPAIRFRLSNRLDSLNDSAD